MRLKQHPQTKQGWKILKNIFWDFIGDLLIKTKAFRKWYLHELGTDLYDLELSEDLLDRKEIYNRKLKEFNRIKALK